MHCRSYCRCINLVGIELECLLLFLLVGKESCSVRHGDEDNLLLQYYYPDLLLVQNQKPQEARRETKARSLTLSLPPSNNIAL